MSHKNTLFYLLLLSTLTVAAQKSALDTTVFDHWPTLIGDGAAGEDGKYFAYLSADQMDGKSPQLNYLALEGKWKRQLKLKAIALPIFANRGKMLLIRYGTDSLSLWPAGSDKIQFISQVSYFKVSPYQHSRYILFLKKDSTLHLRDLISNTDQIFSSVQQYALDPSGQKMLFQTRENGEFQLKIYDLKNRVTKKIYSGTEASGFTFHRSGDQLAFFVKKEGSNKGKEIWIHSLAKGQTVKLAKDICFYEGEIFEIGSEPLYFSDDGERLFFYLKSRGNKKADQSKPNSAPVIWKWNSAQLPTEGVMESNTFLSVLWIQTRKIIRLQHENELIKEVISNSLNYDYLQFLVSNSGVSPWERSWNPAAAVSQVLVSTKDGSRKVVWTNSKNYLPPQLIEKGQYLISYRSKEKDYYLTNAFTGKTVNISNGLKVEWEDSQRDTQETEGLSYGLVSRGIIKGKVYLYDSNDIWALDTGGKSPPENLTRGYGKKNHIRLRLMKGQSLSNPDPLILTGFDTKTMDFGFYQINLAGNTGLRLLSKAAYHYESLDRMIQIKNKSQTLYILSRSSISSPVNYFRSKDLKSFFPITDINPSKSFEWFTASLVEWEVNGYGKNKGIIYKPENFNPSKKYPLIIHYYEQSSEKLNEFLTPEPTSAVPKISWLATHGYVVFVPDIHYKIGDPFNSALTTINSAADELIKRYPWIDKDRMAIQGHSWGGYQTNYILTHTTRFRAAISAASGSDLISGQGSFTHGGRGFQFAHELGQIRLGKTLWESPETYIKNSAVMHADQVNTPVLMMHNSKDTAVPFAQGLEFFLSLRRLQKPAWLLQYPDEGHVLMEKEHQLDYTTKTMEFYDYYLKDKPKPHWMK